jgi:hypothetical protein
MRMEAATLRILGMEPMALIGIALTVIAIAAVGYSLHRCQCDQRLQFLSPQDVNVSYVGNDTVITIRDSHIEVVGESGQDGNGTAMGSPGG